MTDTKTDWRDTVFLPRTPFPMKAGLAQKEPAILARWEAEDLYGQLRRARAGRERFILHDGPPYANGDIHIGHAMNKVLKDIVVRSQSLLGKDAPYVPGWDCHGLPIEWKVEEQYRKRKLDKDQVPKAQFRAECRAYAAHWVGVQREQFRRLGVTGEWDDPYLTMNFSAEAAIVGELLKFAESGQVYRGAKPVMWSPVERTALADAEVEYEEITSTQIDVAFEIVESPIPELVGAHAVIWTTTPWTIPVNQAIAYGPEILYGLYDGGEGRPDILIAVELQNALRDRGFNSYFEKASFRGSDLAGTIARHPMAHLLSSPLVGEDQGGGRGASAPQETLSTGAGGQDHSAADAAGPHPNPSPQGGGAQIDFFLRPRPFLPAAHVTTDAGTGLVHMAPDHGEEDFEVCRAAGIGPVFAVQGDGRYREDWGWLPGQGSVINAKFNAPDGPICADLREAGALLAASADFRHSYPHSWRSKAKVIFRATPQWFIGMDAPINSPSPSGEGLGVGAVPGDSASSTNIPHPNPSPEGEGLSNAPTLRELALDAIDRTRWVPEKSRNRIQSMVENRPDWVISRQRAWGVPIALYLNRRTGDYLRDRQVNARIIAAFQEGGADAWFAADHQAMLGPQHDAAEFEPVQDILDVWFDSGSTHVFTIEQRYGQGVRASLYLEGSDQHRGWFQSSLLESAGTRGRAPYEAVLTHGFTLDAAGKKMSKSIGNAVDPLKVMDESGADILRLWVATTDYFEDVRIGKEILSGATDAYRKLRNTFRYLLGALDGFTEAEKAAPADMPELERWVLHRLAQLSAELKSAAQAYEFDRYVRALAGFANDDLSAFFFDIRKDVLYCEVSPRLPEGTAKRRAYRTVLDIVFHALVRWLAPVIPFTTEEVWGTRFPEGGSVHLLEWPEIDDGWRDKALANKIEVLRLLRNIVTSKVEPLRREKQLGSSLEADVHLHLDPDTRAFEAFWDSQNFAEFCIVAKVTADADYRHPGDMPAPGALADVVVTKMNKCGRCWRHLPEVGHDGELCARCEEVVNG